MASSIDRKMSDTKYDLEKEKNEVAHLESFTSPADDGVQVRAVANAEFAAALENGRINPNSRESWTLYACCLVGFLCACTNGYDGSLMGSIQAMPYFQNYFNSGLDGERVGLINTMYTVGSMVGAFTAGPIADFLGRKRGMAFGAVVILIGTVVITSSQNLSQVIAGRFILGWGISIMTVSAPAYVVEVAPPSWRGRMTGIYNCGWFGGAIPAAGITYGTLDIQSDWSWRLPLAFQGFTCIIVLCTVWFIPESPRWQIAHSKDEEAKAFLIKYHGNNDPNSPLVALQWQEMKEGIAIDGSDKRWWDYSTLFRTRNARRRMAMVLMISIFGQYSGNGLGYYSTAIYANLGYTSPKTQLGFNLLGQFTSAFCALSGAALSDKMRRRPVLIYGTLAAAFCLLINAVMSTIMSKGTLDADGYPLNPDRNIAQTALAFNFLFGCVFSFAYTPLQGAIPTESLENTARGKGLGISGVIVSCFGFINTYPGAIGLKNMKNNFIYIFVGWDCVEALLWYLLCVETQGRTLEELDEIFSDPKPVKRSLEYQKIAIKKNRNGETEAAVIHDA